MADGYISVYRGIEDNWVWKDKPFSKGQAWIDLLMLAKYKDEDFYSNSLHQVIHGKRGTVYCSISCMGHRWGWSRKKVRTFLEQLEGTNMVHTLCTTKGTTVTIVNYDFFQSGGPTKGTTKGTTEGTTEDTTEEQLRNSSGTTEEQLKNTSNKVNKGNKVNKEKKIRAFLSKCEFTEEEGDRFYEMVQEGRTPFPNEEIADAYWKEALRRRNER